MSTCEDDRLERWLGIEDRVDNSNDLLDEPCFVLFGKNACSYPNALEHAL